MKTLIALISLFSLDVLADYMSPSAVYFDKVKVGSEERHHIQFQNTGAIGSSKYVSVSISGLSKDFKLFNNLCDRDVPGGNYCGFDLVFKPEEKKDHSGFVVIDADGEKYYVAVSARGV